LTGAVLVTYGEELADRIFSQLTPG
jgi:hypothetical protein